jgi:hypothetical protein
MSPATIKLGFFALDQIAKWTVAWTTAKANPDMTEAEIDQLVKDTQGTAVSTSDDWRAYRQG